MLALWGSNDGEQEACGLDSATGIKCSSFLSEGANRIRGEWGELEKEL